MAEEEAASGEIEAAVGEGGEGVGLGFCWVGVFI
jgi:hypothetical protein